MIKIDGQKINEVLSRGVEEIIEREDLEKKLKSGKQLRIKHGIDPTGPKIHLGRALQFWKLKDFQDLGHKIVLIIGDFTAQIGDASDKDAMRRPLFAKEIKKNMKDYTKQIGKILDMKKVELHYNSQWFNKMKIKNFILLQMRFTAQQLIQRRNFKKRWDEGKPIGAHELDYPILQGYDSVMVKADVEIGGSDQLFNLGAGRWIQRDIFKQKPQDIMTLKMLNGLDGRKMSTSWGNIITIVDEPNDMYGKIMSMKDELINEYLELATRLSKEKVKEIKKLENPRDQKSILAKEIVKMYHGEKDAEKAEKEFNKTFKDKEFPSDVKKIHISKMPILDLLVEADLASSKSEAKRLILQGAVRVDGVIEKNWQKIIEPVSRTKIQVGPRKFLELV